MIDALLELLFPSRCHDCQASGTALCRDCAERIPRADPVYDPGNAMALYDYGHSTVRDAVWQLKYHRKDTLAKALVRHAGPDIAAHVTSLVTTKQCSAVYLVPIPQHRTKTFQRGFNQSRVIARWIRQFVPQVIILSALQKTRSNDAQARTTSKQERERNIAHSMAPRQAGLRLDPHALYIVVDDVITTGSTVRETSRALRAAGAVHIYAIALGHGYADRSKAFTFKIS